MLYRFVTCTVGDRICLPKVCIFGIRIILGQLILRNSTHGRSSESQAEVTCAKDIYTVRESTLVRVSPLLFQEEGMTLSIETYHAEGQDLNLQNSLTLFYCACPVTDSSLSPTCFSSAEDSI